LAKNQRDKGRIKYDVRACRNRRELTACVELQKQIWGYENGDAYPLRMLINLVRIGGVVLGAFVPGGTLVGFVIAMPAWHGPLRYWHSLALGVAVDHQNRGLGSALKWRQRRLALRNGLELIEWTFDPMRAKNAFLNLVRLGAVARRYIPDCYGPVQSKLQQGLPSDRLICEWWLNSPRVCRAAAGKPPRATAEPASATVPIPSEMGDWALRSPAQARAALLRVRKQLRGHFAAGLAVTGISIDGATARYVLDPAAAVEGLQPIAEAL
jgi:predicted GNAT superfamily acetyltransferase